MKQGRRNPRNSGVQYSTPVKSYIYYSTVHGYRRYTEYKYCTRYRVIHTVTQCIIGNVMFIYIVFSRSKREAWRTCTLVYFGAFCLSGLVW